MRLLVIDGNSLMNRAFYAIRLLSTKDGRFTNAIVGFLNMLGRLREQSGAEGIAAAFDVHAPTFRHEMYADYKAGRKPMPEELRQQMPVIKELLTLMGCTVVEQAGFEADDILGTLAAAATAQGGDCFLATGDRDAFQLVDEHVTVLYASTHAGADATVFDPAAIQEKYGLTPPQLIDLKALMGDASDHIPGVPGVGEKTALELMHRFGSLDALYAALPADLRPALAAKLTAGRDSAYLSRTLGTIRRDAPIECDIEAYRLRDMQREELAKRLASLELFKLIERWGLDTPAPVAAETAAPAVPQEQEGAAALADALAHAARTKRLDILPDDTSLWVLFDGRAMRLDSGDAACEQLLPLLGDPAIEKRTHDGKRLFAWMLAHDTRPAGFTMDTLLAGYLLNPLAPSYTLPRLAQEYGFAPTEEAAWLLPPLADALTNALTERDMLTLLREMELPLALVLADMEAVGFAVDRAGIDAFGKSLDARIDALQGGVWDAVGYSFNLNSPKQLATALFEKLQLPAGKKTKSGYSTNAEVLEKLRTVHPAVDMLLEYRSLSKLRSTYCDGLLKVIGEDERIHSSFNQTETRTGRISSTEPNLQNIPVRQPLGRELRRFFRAREGWVLVDADYSQIELRVLAHMADEPTMKEAFNHGGDIHRLTASQVFGVPEDMVTPQMRSRAKAVNFGIIYGIGPHSLSEDIGVSYGEAKHYIDSYLANYSAVAGFMTRLVEDATASGYARTLFGRQRPMPELKAANKMMRAAGERIARNTPIQGTAADIIKLAMIRVDRRLREENLRARLILQVHDELIVEAPADEAAHVAVLLRDEMEAAADLSVRLEADVHSGDTWYDAKV